MVGNIKRDDRNRAERGWRKRGIYDEPRLSEVIRMYGELGFEVRLESFEPGKETDCTECMRASAERFKTVYTRKQNEYAKKRKE